MQSFHWSAMTLSPRMENWIKLFFGSLVFTLVGLGITYLAGQVSTLDCVKTDGQPVCRLSVSFMDSIQLKEMSIQKLDSASVEEDCDDDGCTYRVVLNTGFGPQVFTDGSDSNYGSKQAKADQINQFLQSPDVTELQVKDGGGFWAYFCFMFVLGGLFMGGKLIVEVIRYLLAIRNDDQLPD
jgi:hypothetical protein